MAASPATVPNPCLGDRIVLKGSRLSRRQRAKKACTHCRARKVRCDINIHGWPCTVCRGDSSECMVVARKRVVHRKRAVAGSGRDFKQRSYMQMLMESDSLEHSPSYGQDPSIFDCRVRPILLQKMALSSETDMHKFARNEKLIAKDFEAKLDSMSVIGSPEVHVSLSPCGTSQHESGWPPAKILYSKQDFGQSSLDGGHDNRSCTSSSEGESHVSLLSHHDQRDSDEASSNKEFEPDHRAFEACGSVWPGETAFWRDAGIWSILHEKEWPRLD